MKILILIINNPFITNNKKKILEARGIILPGVGAFNSAITILNNLEIVDIIKDFVKSGKTLLGLCLGMQLLLEKSFEFGEHLGIGLIPGNITYIGDSFQNNKMVRIPHMGWNTINIKNRKVDDKIFNLLPDKFDVYFAHSFWLKTLNENFILTETVYNNKNFCSGLKKDNIIGFQFHPENSGPVGLQLLKNIFNY